MYSFAQIGSLSYQLSSQCTACSIRGIVILVIKGPPWERGNAKKGINSEWLEKQIAAIDSIHANIFHSRSPSLRRARDDLALTSTGPGAPAR